MKRRPLIIATLVALLALAGCGSTTPYQQARERSAQAGHAAKAARQQFRCATYGEGC